MSPFLSITLMALAGTSLSPEAPIAPRYTALSAETINESSDEPQYVDCIRQVEDDVAKGRASAERWVLEGGGLAAQHCRAIADRAAGFPKLAAIRLTDIAEQLSAEDSAPKATIYAEAALAFLEADLPGEARAAIEAGIDLDPARGDLHIIAAKTYARLEEWQKAADAVSEAQSHDGLTAESLTIRARARRALAKNDLAAEDVASALRLDPFNLDALVLRGELIQAGIPINVNYRRVE